MKFTAREVYLTLKIKIPKPQSPLQPQRKIKANDF